MKPIDRLVLLALCLAAGISLSWAAQQTIGIGTVANDGTGDTFRDAFDKVNDNFTELYAAGGNSLLFTDGSTTPKIDNTTAETSIFSGTVPGGTLGTTGAIKVVIHGTIKNDSGSSQGISSLAIKYGGTTLWSDSTASTAFTNNANPRPFTMEFILFADASASAQRLGGTFGPFSSTGAATTGYGDLTGTAPILVHVYGGTSTVASASDQTLNVTMTLTTNSDAFEVTTLKASAWKL